MIAGELQSLAQMRLGLGQRPEFEFGAAGELQYPRVFRKDAQQVLDQRSRAGEIVPSVGELGVEKAELGVVGRHLAHLGQ